MKNKIIIKDVYSRQNKIYYDYDIEGEEQFKKLFWMGELFSVEYNESIEDVPKSILIIPLICNVLPIAWLNNAIIYIPELDYTFYKSIRLIKKGYEKMLPNLEFKAKLKIKKKVHNDYEASDRVDMCFSGGVDSYSTLISRMEEKPDLVTIWGADIDFENEKGWEVVKDFVQKVGMERGLKNVLIRTAVRRFIDNSELEKQYHDILKGDWWLVMQHGIGLLGNFAPYAYKYKLKTIYIPSTFTKYDNFVCASNPNIDNNLKFGNTSVFHEGYEYTRQDKVKNICDYVKKTKDKIKIRTCFRSLDGDNCCKCPKCYMTLFAIVSQGMDPNKFGFKFNDEILQKMKESLSEREFLTPIQRSLWKQIQNSCIENEEKFKNDYHINWIYDMDFEEIPQEENRKEKSIV